MADWNNSATPEADLGLREAGNGNAAAPGPPRDAEAAARAREKGWSEPQPLDYNRHANVATRGNADTSSNTLVEVPKWAHDAAKYEYRGEAGILGPVMADLELQLFGGTEMRLKKGVRWDLQQKIQAIVESVHKISPVMSLEDAGIHPAMLENCKKLGYNDTTPIQAYTIPAVLLGHDVIGIAQTAKGSGKTGAFLIPALSKLMGKAKKLGGPRPDLSTDPGARVRAEPLILVVAPTRELCIQIFDEARRLCYRSMLRPCIAYGGGPIREQRDDLRKGCDVLIATPGRLRDFMKDPSLLALHRLRFTVIDEADEMLHEDWAEDLQEILAGADASQDSQHQYLLFSATFDKRMRTLAKRYLAQNYVRIRIGRIGSTVSTITQRIVWVDGNKKKDALYDLLLDSPPARTLIFVKSKKMVDIVDDYLYNRGLPTTAIHADRTQLEREDAIRSFRIGKCPILITTGVSARGLDINNVMHVINYDLPSIEYNGKDEYIHRIGRTGRLGNIGAATSFYNEADEALAPFLAALLVENDQAIPDFLEEYAPPADQPLNFDDDSADEVDDFGAENNTNTDDAGGTWGNGSADVVEVAKVGPAADTAWGGTDTSNDVGGASW
ncbi:hypothetical protein LTS08_000630 [Lithohypha guttulata]|nr:hypothetical protein LTS08_000630 [Lithohypha guttulata]